MTILHPPKQARSRQTLERIANAALAILEEEGPDGVTVQAVVARAGSSVGSFYARFRGKDDLLEYLGERIWDDVLGRWDTAVAARSWSKMDLAELASGAVQLLYDVRRSRVTQLRAMDRMATGGDAFDSFRRHLLEGLESLILERRTEIVHQNPDLGVRLGLRAVLGAIDADLETGPEEELTREVVLEECTDLLLAYLAGAMRGRGGQVDFFDVWG
jgi:AcrR family transcriptional regulator